MFVFFVNTPQTSILLSRREQILYNYECVEKNLLISYQEMPRTNIFYSENSYITWIHSRNVFVTTCFCIKF